MNTVNLDKEYKKQNKAAKSIILDTIVDLIEEHVHHLRRKEDTLYKYRFMGDIYRSDTCLPTPIQLYKKLRKKVIRDLAKSILKEYIKENKVIFYKVDNTSKETKSNGVYTHKQGQVQITNLHGVDASTLSNTIVRSFRDSLPELLDKCIDSLTVNVPVLWNSGVKLSKAILNSDDTSIFMEYYSKLSSISDKANVKDINVRNISEHPIKAISKASNYNCFVYNFTLDDVEIKPY